VIQKDAGKVAALLFFSGLSALVYQTVWLRQFRLIFGASTYATGAVLAIFMFGLGLGSALLGRRADAKERPLAYYARLELLIAAAAAVSPVLLGLAAKIYFASGGSPNLGIAGATLLRLVLATLVLGPATVLMGGTLPAAARAVATDEDSARRVVALLYGVNTFGAVAGTLLSTFVLLERFGNRATLLAAVGVNLAVALVARALSMSITTSGETSTTSRDDDRLQPAAPRTFVYAASAIVGFAFLLMELVWYRMLSPILGGTTYMFGLVLAVALAGIAIGGVAYAFLRRGPATVGGFAITCSFEALAIAFPFALGDRIALFANTLGGLGAMGFGGHLAGWVLVTGIVVFPSAVLAGIQFPLLIALLGRGRDDVGRQIGAAYAWNTLGAIAGSLAGGFGLLPLLSAPGAWRLVVIVLALLGFAASLFTFRDRQLFAGAATAIAGALALLCIAALGPTAVWRHSGIGAARAPSFSARNELRGWINGQRRALAWDRDGRESSVAVVVMSDVSFMINGKSDGAARGDAGTQVMCGIIPAALHGRPETSLVVGLGTGSTAGWLGVVPSMQRVDVVELEPVVLDVARACTAVNADVLRNPKVHVTIGDAREVLLTMDRKFDVIASEPSNPYRAGIASLFTREFYLAVRSRLRPRGVFAQWVQSYAVHPETLREIYATLTGVFPNVQTWWTASGDLMLIASAEPLVIDADELRARLQTEPYRSAAMNTWRVSSVEGFIAHMFANEDFAIAAARQAETVNTDDRPVIEFGFARSIDTGASLHRQIAADATRMQATRPRNLRGAFDWSAVEKQRAWTEKKEPSNIGELSAFALNAARQGDARTEGWSQIVRRVQPIEADLILAMLRTKQLRYDEATGLLRRAFLGYRKSAWPEEEIMAKAFELAVELGRTSPERARAMNDALAQPFAAMQHEQSRVFSRILIAPLFDRCGPATIEALRAAEPHPIWNKQILSVRAACYALAGLDLAPRAKEDLARYEEGEQGEVVQVER
jgi:spermidine synthase